MAQKFTLTANKDAKTKYWKSDPAQLDISGLKTLLKDPIVKDDKGGPCFLPGTFEGEQRSANAVKQIDMLVYDVDGQQTFAEAREKLTEAGVYALMYTTYSHLSSETRILTDHFYKWIQKEGIPEKSAATRENVLKYLAKNKKGHLQNVVYDVSSSEAAAKHVIKDADGLHIRVFHDPVEKFRVVLPLATPIPVGTLSYTTKKSIEEYKSIYHGVGQTLGLHYDSACEDPSRIHFLPSCPASRLNDYVLTEVGDANSPTLLDWTKYPRVVPQSTKPTSVPRDSLVVKDKNGVPIDLLRWEEDNKDFDVEGCLSAHLPPDEIKDARSRGGFHITCPHEADHSSTGGLGTFCCNADETHGWTISCSHNGCSGRKRLDYIRAFVEQGVLDAEALGITPTVVEDNTLTSAMSELGIDPSTLTMPKMDMISVEEYEDAPYDGDDLLSAEEVYAAALQEVILAKNAIQAAKALGRITHKECEYDLDEIFEVLAKSDISGEGISGLLIRLSKTMYFDAKNARTEVSSLRDKLVPMEGRLEELLASRATGHELEIEKARIADYYLVDKRAITDKYHQYELELIKQRHGQIFSQRFPKLTAQWAKLRQGNRMVFIDMPESLKVGDAVTQRPSDLENWMRNENKTDIITSGKSMKEVKTFLYRAWVEECTEIKEFFGVTFIPGGPRVTPDNKFNLWSDKLFVPRIEGDCSIITNHILNVWCSGDVTTYNWVMTWLAAIFQKPDYKPPTSLALLGAQGTGKSIIFEHGLAKILGPYFGTSADREDIVGRWSGHLVGKLLWVAEESLFAGDKRAMNKLKSRISSATVDVEYKGLDKFSIPSFTRFVFTSNQVHALNLESDDRRFCVLPTSTAYQQDTAYFTRMKAWLDNGGVSYLYNFLMSWNPESVGLTWTSLMSPPYNEAKRQQAEMSLEPADSFFLDIIKYGRVIDAPSSAFPDGVISWSLEEPLYVKGNILRSAYESYLKYHMGNTARFDRNKYAALASRYLGNGENINDMMRLHRVNGVPVRTIALPPRKEFIEGAVTRRHVTSTDQQYALDNPDSHLYNEPISDVL